MLILKAIFLFIGIWWSIVNLYRLCYKVELSTVNILLQAIGIAGFIFVQWII